MRSSAKNRSEICDQNPQKHSWRIKHLWKLEAWHFTSKTRSSHRSCSLKKDVLKKFVKFTGKHQCWSLFFHKITGQQPATLLKKRSNTGVFLLILRNFWEYLFQRTHSGDCFCKTFLHGWSQNKWEILLLLCLICVYV